MADQTGRCQEDPEADDPMLSDALDLRVAQQQQEHQQHQQPRQPEPQALESPAAKNRPARSASTATDVVERRCAQARGIVNVKWDITRKNKASIVIDGYKMTESRSGKDGRVFWRCSKRFCPATAISIGRRLLSVRRVTAASFHSHPPAGQDEFFSADYQASGEPTEVVVKWALLPPRGLGDARDNSPLKLASGSEPSAGRVAADEQQPEDEADAEEDEEDIVVDCSDEEEATGPPLPPTSDVSRLNLAPIDPLNSPPAADFPMPPPPPPPHPSALPPHRFLRQPVGCSGGSVASLNSPEFLALLSAAMAAGVIPPGSMPPLPGHQQQPQPPQHLSPQSAAARCGAGIFANTASMPPPPPLSQNSSAAAVRFGAPPPLPPAGSVDNAQLMQHLRRLDAYFRAGINGLSNAVCGGVGGRAATSDSSPASGNDQEFIKQLFRYMDGLSRVMKLSERLQ